MSVTFWETNEHTENKRIKKIWLATHQKNARMVTL